jgi:hypothetical protein
MADDDIDDVTFDLEERFDGKLRVQIGVSSGGVSAVSFTTMVSIDPNDKVRAQSKLRDIATMLRAALPFSELKAEEVEFNNKRNAPVGVSAKGPQDAGASITEGQDALKNLIAPEGQKKE